MSIGKTVMRVLPPALILLMACWPAWAQTIAAKPKPAPAQPASPPGAAVKGAYAGMTEVERLTIQSDLIWTGDYNGTVGAEFGDRAVAAVKSFQKRNGGKETGILNPDERTKLAQSAKAKQEHVGWRMVDDAATGTRLGIPAKLTPQSSPSQTGSRWQSVHGEVQIETFRFSAPGTTLASVFEQQRKEPADRKVEYNVLRPDFFVVSGLQGLKKFYVRGQVKDNDVRGLTILYDQAMEGIMDPVAVAMSSAFAAFPAQVATANAVPAPRRKVEYGTGLVVSAAGDIVTDSDLLVGCETIVVPGLGHAERIADDKDVAVALVRVNGAHDLKPVALANATPPPGDITLVGIVDPQAQNGGNAVSTARGRVVPANGNALDPVPSAGFAGAAAVDANGAVTGIVGFRPQAAMVPTQAISRFLETQNVVANVGRAGIDGAKAAAVRVICIRK